MGFIMGFIIVVILTVHMLNVFFLIFSMGFNAYKIVILKTFAPSKLVRRFLQVIFTKKMVFFITLDLDKEMGPNPFFHPYLFIYLAHYVLEYEYVYCFGPQVSLSTTYGNPRATSPAKNT